MTYQGRTTRYYNNTCELFVARAPLASTTSATFRRGSAEIIQR